MSEKETLHKYLPGKHQNYRTVGKRAAPYKGTISGVIGAEEDEVLEEKVMIIPSINIESNFEEPFVINVYLRGDKKVVISALIDMSYQLKAVINY